jgi:hypothetical protein
VTRANTAGNEGSSSFVDRARNQQQQQKILGSSKMRLIYRFGLFSILVSPRHKVFSWMNPPSKGNMWITNNDNYLYTVQRIINKPNQSEAKPTINFLTMAFTVNEK